MMKYQKIQDNLEVSTHTFSQDFVFNLNAVWEIPETLRTTCGSQNSERVKNKGKWYLSLPPTRQDLTHGQWPEGPLEVVIRGGEGWTLLT